MAAGDDFERLSVRALKYLCEQEGVAVPLVPKRNELIEAIRKHRERLEKKSPAPRRKRTVERFETPRVPPDAGTSAMATPVYRFRAGQSPAPSSGSCRTSRGPSPQVVGQEPAGRWVLIVVVVLAIALLVTL